MRSLLRRPGGVFLGLLVVAALSAPLVDRYGPTEMDKYAVLSAPSPSHPMGTDQFGRDILSRVLFGARIALVISVGATLLAAAVGVPLGLWAGFRGGWADSIIMRAADTLLAIPAVLLAMALVAVAGPGSLNVGLAIAIVGFPQFARLVRSGMLGQKSLEYVDAAVAAGAGDARIIFRTILPNLLSPILVQIPVGVSRAILLEASLSFLGLGTRPPDPSWGLMISESREYMYAAPLDGIFPGVVIAFTVLALNAVSDQVRLRWRA